MTMDAKVMYLQSLGFDNIDPVTDNSLNMTNPVVGRIDLWIAGLYKGKESVAHRDSKVIKPVMIVRAATYHLAHNLKTSNATLNALRNVQNRYVDGLQ